MRGVLLLLKRLAACIGLALLVWGTSCAHRSRHDQSAHRTKEKRTTWETAETAASQTQSVETKKTAGTKQTRRWAPDGKLMEEVIEQWGSDGRVQVSASDSSSRQASGATFHNVIASSSSTRVADTKAGVAWWPWLLALAAVVAGVTIGWPALRKRIRSVIPFWG